MSDWAKGTVGDVTRYQRAGGTPSVTNPSYYGGEIPFVVIEDISKSQRFIDETEKTLSAKGLENSAAWLIEEPHVLYSMYATVGKPIINRIRCATNQAIIALKENERIDQEFLYYQLLFIRPSVYKYTAQTTQSNLNAGVVRRLPISYPKDKALQKRIARVLRTIDGVIEGTEALIEKYQQIKAGLMHDLFTRGIGADGKLRPPREQAPELYQQTPIGWVPKEWRIFRITDLAAPFKGSTVIGPFGSDLVMSDYRDEGTPVVFVRDVKEDGFMWVSNVFVSQSKTRKLFAHRVTSGDLLATKMGLPPCLACVYPEDMPMGIITADMIRMTADRNKVDPHWLSFAVNHDRVRRQVAAITAGVTRPKVTLADFRNLSLATPSMEEQLRVNAILNRQAQLASVEKEKLIKLHKEKAGLMHDLLTGARPVSVAAETPKAAAHV